MDLHPLFSLQLLLVGVLFPTIVAAQTLSNPDCPDKCGDVSIPFPFGVGDDCYLHSYFNITCDNSTEPPKTYLTPLIEGNNSRTFEVSEISVDGQLNILSKAAYDCYDAESNTSAKTKGRSTRFSLAKFTVSKSRNKFTVIGCASYGYLQGSSVYKTYGAGCMTSCGPSYDNVDDSSCSGSGCCQIDIPNGLSLANVSAAYNFSALNDSEFILCTYSFIVDEGKFNFSRDYLKNMRDKDVFPVVLDWWVEEEKNAPVACKGNAKKLVEEEIPGYRCVCQPGYEGNPYLGCTDIDECKNETLNNCTHHCKNKVGYYTCSCPKWYKGDGTKDGQGCVLQTYLIILIITCVGATVMVTFMCSSWIYLVLKHKRKLKQKERFFRENGGFALQHKLSGGEGSSSFRIFTAVELDKATNNYDKDMIIGKGGFGTVYKGILTDRTEVAIKRSTTNERFQIDQFVNEVLILSQINHRNVVKLLGCCLETQTPLLVYEFIPNGTIFDHLHNKSKSSSAFPWEIRLKVAAESAIALTYLHFEASVPIVHRDVKTTNILLGSNYIARLQISDFGASRFVPLDANQISTMVQGTLGYLDPEYFLTSQLTDKSDVYSFGVVLVELLTGLKPLSFERPEAQRSLAMHFVLSVKHDSLSDIIDPDLMNQGKDEQLKEVAKIAKKCLALKGEERPTMKEVAKELEELFVREKHPWDQFNSEETERLLMQHKNSSGGGGGSSGFNIQMMPIGSGR